MEKGGAPMCSSENWAAWRREFEQRLAPSDLENFGSARGVYMAFISTGGWH